MFIAYYLVGDSLALQFRSGRLANQETQLFLGKALFVKMSLARIFKVASFRIFL